VPKNEDPSKAAGDYLVRLAQHVLDNNPGLAEDFAAAFPKEQADSVELQKEWIRACSPGVSAAVEAAEAMASDAQAAVEEADEAGYDIDVEVGVEEDGLGCISPEEWQELTVISEKVDEVWAAGPVVAEDSEIPLVFVAGLQGALTPPESL